MPSLVRATLGIATYNRDPLPRRHDPQRARSQDSPDLEVLVVDGSTHPNADEVLSQFAGEERMRVVRHAGNREVAAAYNTVIEQSHGQLITLIGEERRTGALADLLAAVPAASPVGPL